MAIAEAPQAVSTEMTPAESRHLRALEGRIERGLQTFRDVGLALMEIREDRLYRATHTSFEAYCLERWNLEKARAYQFLGAAEVVKAIGDGAGPTNEAQARELVALVHEDPEAVRQVWAEVQKSGKPITAEAIREVVQVRTNGGPHEAPSETETLVAAIARLGGQYTRWMQGRPSRKDKVLVSAALEKFESLTT